MQRRIWFTGLAVLLALPMLMAATASAAPAAPVTVVPAGCDFDDVSGDAAVTGDAVTHGFVAFHGGNCPPAGVIWSFEGSGSSWTRTATPYRGRVLAVADDGGSTFLLYQAADGIRITRRTHGGTLTGGRRISGFTGTNPFPTGDLVALAGQWWAVWTEQVGSTTEGTPMQLFQGKTIGAGDCIDPFDRRRITFRATNDESPSLVLRPASAGASGADLVWSRNDGLRGESGHIWLASADCTAAWTSRQLSFAGDVDLDPDMFRYAGRNHVVWNRDFGSVVYVSSAGGAYTGRAFTPGGATPKVAASGTSRFVSYLGARQHPFAAVYRGGTWTVSDLTPGAGAQRLVAVTAAGGLGTVLAASEGSDRLYAISGI
jgi:hypothetical protein